MLQERFAVGVTPEASLPAEMFGLNGLSPFRLYRRQDACKYIDQVLSETKLGNWEIDYSEALDSLTFPSDTVALFRSLLETYGRKVGVGNGSLVYKGDPVMPWNFRSLPGRLDAKVILIRRDPRAVLNSQLNSDYGYRGKFTYSVNQTAREWKSLAEATILTHSNELVVVYEDLLRRPDAVMEEVGSFLGAQAGEVKQSSHFLAAIPERERHLHSRVGSEPELARIDAWKGELGARELAVLEDQLGPLMQSCGYKLESERRSSSPERAMAIVADTCGRVRTGLARHLALGVRRPGYVMRKAYAKYGVIPHRRNGARN